MPQYNRNLNPHAKELRRRMTPQEKRLWYDFLRTHPIKIYKQRIIYNYIADFYCHSAKLVIELDGNHHKKADNIEYDDIRTKHFNSMGISVIRFSNNEIDTNFDKVCDTINKHLNT